LEKDLTRFNHRIKFFRFARVAQLVEPHVANVIVAGSSPVSRSEKKVLGCKYLSLLVVCPGGGIGRRLGLKIPWAV
jgi:hypothetical protein